MIAEGGASGNVEASFWPYLEDSAKGLNVRLWLIADFQPHPELRLLCPRKRTLEMGQFKLALQPLSELTRPRLFFVS